MLCYAAETEARREYMVHVSLPNPDVSAELGWSLLEYTGHHLMVGS